MDLGVCLKVDAQGVSDCAFLFRAASEIGVASETLQVSPNPEG